MFRLHVAAQFIPMALNRVNVLLVDAGLLQDLACLVAVLFREPLIVDVMHQTDSSPLLLIFTQQTGEMPHHAFDGQTMGKKGRRIVVLAQQLVCFISRWFQVSLLLIQIHLHLVKSYQMGSRKSTGSTRLAPGHWFRQRLIFPKSLAICSQHVIVSYYSRMGMRTVVE